MRLCVPGPCGTRAVLEAERGSCMALPASWNLEMPLIVRVAGGFSTAIYSSVEWGFVAGCSKEMGAMRGRRNWLNWNPSPAGLGLGACSGKRFKTWGWHRSAPQGFAPQHIGRV